MRRLVGHGFDSHQVHVNLTDEQEKDLDEQAKRFSETIGDGSHLASGSAAEPKDTKGGK